MAGNLFFLKGWTVTLIAALFALSAKDANPRFTYIALLPIIIFWVLDGYFLAQERQYRALYDHARKLNEEQIDFSLNASNFKKRWHNCWGASMFAPTLLWFYGSLFVILVITAYLLNR